MVAIQTFTGATDFKALHLASLAGRGQCTPAAAAMAPLQTCRGRHEMLTIAVEPSLSLVNV